MYIYIFIHINEFESNNRCFFQLTICFKQILIWTIMKSTFLDEKRQYVDEK